jgi:uracil phosphoribosyltransferase
VTSSALPEQVHVGRHPLLLHKVAQLRSTATEPPQFRALVRDLTQLLLYEAIADVALEPIRVCTPLADCVGHRLAERIGLLPILRAGLGMADAILEMVPTAVVWHLGLFRDHETCLPVTYYNKLPADLRLDLSLVLDPMLATGGSAVAAIDILKEGAPGRIKYLGLIAAPEGLAALDSHLNERRYIVPGLGDAGDRQFGTH